MFHGSNWKIGRILGIPILVNWSWLVVFALITIMFAGQFSSGHPHWTAAEQWSLGVATSLLCFGSVLFHELGHSRVAIHYKIPVLSITLFIFGGVAQIARDPDRPIEEFNVAVAGPVASALLAGVFYGISRLFAAESAVSLTAYWLFYINAMLAVFNLVPGFPLDGGRILRAIAWAKTKDYNRATRLASRSGQAIAYLLMLAGIVVAIKSGDWLSGLWWVLIGWFLLTEAQRGKAQAAVRQALEGLRAADVMSAELPTIDRSLSLEDYLAEVLRTGRRCHLVLGNNELVGLITPRNAGAAPRDEWAHTSIQAVMQPRDRIEWAQADESALGILERMQIKDVNQMPVLRDQQVVGMVSRDGMLRVIQTRLRLERFAHA